MTNGGNSTLSGGSQARFSRSTSVLAGDSEEFQSSTANRRGVPPREGAAIVDPLTMQILRRTGTEATVRQRARKDNGDRKGINDDVLHEGVPGLLERHTPDVVRHVDAQPQVREKKSVFVSTQSSGRRRARLIKHAGRVFLSSAA